MTLINSHLQSGLANNLMEQKLSANHTARKARENDVIAHEQAHHSAAGFLSTGITYDRDSDGFIVGGQCGISLPGMNRANPEETMRLSQVAMAAASAPGADMSSQDQAVYGEASRRYFQASQLMSRMGGGVGNQLSGQNPSAIQSPGPLQT